MQIRPLPLRSLRVMPGESTGSYVTRLAARHGRPASWLLGQIGAGETAADVDPRFSELYMDRAARDRLAALCGRPVEEMTRALASLREELLLPDGRSEPAWEWPWRPRAGYLVRACELCAASRNCSHTVWLICPDPWHICVRHGRFMDNSHDDRVRFIDLAPGPHVVDAERRRLKLVRRLGLVGRVLVADAFGLLAYASPPSARLNSGRTAPLRLLPEAVDLASLLAQVEPRRLEGRLPRDEYELWLQHAKDATGLTLGRAIAYWSRRHVPFPKTWAPPADARRQRLTPDLPHEGVREMMSVEELTCVPWKLLAQVERPYG